MSKTRNRNFCGVCYDEQIKQVRDYLIEYERRGVIRAYYFIAHEAEDEEKQNHFHFLIEFYDAKTISSINKNSGLRDGLVEVCTDVRSYACYMIHKYEVDKKRYDPSLVGTNDMERYRELINAENNNQVDNDKIVFKKFVSICECEPLMPLYKIINLLCSDKNITIKTVRRNVYLFKVYYASIVDECNIKIFEKVRER